MTGTLELDRHLLLAREFYGHRLEIDMPFREDYYLAYSEIRFDTDYYVKPCTFHAIDYIYLTPN